MKTIFILSTGRCGSKSIVDTLNQVENVKAFHEPNPSLIEENAKHHFGDFTENPIVLMLKKRKKLIDETHEAGFHYIESSHFLSSFVDPLRKAFPDAFFVHLIRDGRDVVRSAMSRSWYKWKDDRTVVYGWPAPYYMSRFEKCCYFWDFQNRMISQSFERLTEDQKMIIKVEKLHLDVTFLMNRLDLNPSSIKVEHSHKTPEHTFPHYLDWNDAQRKICHIYMGNTLKKFGYTKWE